MKWKKRASSQRKITKKKLSHSLITLLPFDRIITKKRSFSVKKSRRKTKMKERMMMRKNSKMMKRLS